MRTVAVGVEGKTTTSITVEAALWRRAKAYGALNKIPLLGLVERGLRMVIGEDPAGRAQGVKTSGLVPTQEASCARPAADARGQA